MDLRNAGNGKDGFDLNQALRNAHPAWTCPNGFGLVEHFSSDGRTCHCFDRSQKYLGEYGYHWSSGKDRWVGGSTLA